MQEIAYAKINLALHVRERQPDGYHRIETLFAFCEDGDRLEARASEDLQLRVLGPCAADVPTGGDNLVLRAADALRQAYCVEAGALLTLDKRLPVASGIGGGSADAAAALRLLGRLWEVPAEEAGLLKIAAHLGADVPACLLSRTARGDGRGDELTMIDADALSRTPVLLVNPGVSVSTAAVFKAWDGIDMGPLDDFRGGRNDLEGPARGIAPEVDDVLVELGGADLARMSGSGATCFGLYGSEGDRDAAAARIAAAHPGWWLLATRLR